MLSAIKMDMSVPGKMRFKFEQSALILLAGVYVLIHYTFLAAGESNGEAFNLPVFSLYAIPAIMIAMASIPLLFKIDNRRLAWLGFTGMCIFMAQIILLNYLNDFVQHFQILYWVALFIFSIQCWSKKSLIYFFIINLILILGTVTADTEMPFPAWMFIIWYTLLSAIAFWVVTRRLSQSSMLSVKELELREREEGFRLIFDEAPYGIAITSKEKEIIRVNKALSKILGYPLDELQKLSSRDLTHPDDENLTYDLFNKATYKDKDQYSTEKRYIRKDGETITCNLTVKIIRDEKGKHLLNIGLIEDITRRKKAEEQIREYAEKLKQSNQDLEDFAYVVSHDLREPLRMISSYLQLLDRKFKDHIDQEAELFMHFAIDGAMRMDELIKDLLGYSRVGRENVKDWADLNEIVHLVESNLSVISKEAQAKIEFDKLPEVFANKVQMIALFQNLIQNAIKYKRPDLTPHIKISAEKKFGHWLFSVKDNGMGIGEAYLESIFTIFNRVDKKDKTSGTGIGLAICKKIMKLHEGRIWVESEPGKGSTFYFSLPVYPKAKSQNGTPQKMARRQKSST